MIRRRFLFICTQEIPSNLMEWCHIEIWFDALCRAARNFADNPQNNVKGLQSTEF